MSFVPRPSEQSRSIAETQDAGKTDSTVDISTIVFLHPTARPAASGGRQKSLHWPGASPILVPNRMSGALDGHDR